MATANYDLGSGLGLFSDGEEMAVSLGADWWVFQRPMVTSVNLSCDAGPTDVMDRGGDPYCFAVGLPTFTVDLSIIAATGATMETVEQIRTIRQASILDLFGEIHERVRREAG